ncbi:MAG TPA: ABC transporter ATP-binding protein, partial [Thermaerobacter sp.]
MNRLLAQNVTLSYGREAVIRDLTLEIPDGAITAIIGPNGCGKSTLLRALARLMIPRGGAVLLDGQAIHRRPTRKVARELGLMAQHVVAPEAITVEDLVSRGRYPHQSWLRPMSEANRATVERALEWVGMTDLRHRPVDELSGGQRQRAWLAMTLAQDTPILLLDEPTTYLDVAQQQAFFALIRRLNREEGRTIVMVLHDVNDAAQVSDHLIVM